MTNRDLNADGNALVDRLLDNFEKRVANFKENPIATKAAFMVHILEFVNAAFKNERAGELLNEILETVETNGRMPSQDAIITLLKSYVD